MRVIFLFLMFAGVLFFSPINHAALIFESQSFPNSTPNNGALGVTDTFWVIQNFEITTDTNVSSVGGYFDNFGDNQTLFAAIIALDSLFDRPNSFDLTTSDVVETTTFEVETTSGADFTAQLNVFLSAGFYAVAFGQGAFGADDSVGFGDVSLPDILDDFSTTAVLPLTAVPFGNFGLPPRFVLQGATPRVFVNGSVAVSAPSTSFLCLLGFISILISHRKTKAASQNY
jgi:hypothetical protein